MIRLQLLNTNNKMSLKSWTRFCALVLTYIAVVTCTKPSHVADLIIYFNLIINSQRLFQDSDWVLYEHQFWQKSAIMPTLQWGTMAHCGTCHTLTALLDYPPAQWYLHSPSQPGNCLYAWSLMKTPVKDVPILNVNMSMFANTASMSTPSLTTAIRLSIAH